MQIVVLGAGYVGLVTAACFAEFGVDVVCVDQDAERIARLRDGIMPVYEPGLAELTARNLAAGRLAFADDTASHIPRADAVFIAVGTPSRRGDGHADLRYVEEAVAALAPQLAAGRFTVVVTKSTVPVGTCRMVLQRIAQINPGADFAVCANPEFLSQGSALRDFMQPDRLVIGVEDVRAAAIMRALYRPLLMLETPVVETGLETAELIKYAGNAFLAAKIGLMNEIADLCERTGADVRDVAEGLGLDRRIGREFLRPGPGFGGSCLPKDALALIKTAREAGAPVRIVETVVAVNDQRKQAMAARVVAACGGSVQGKAIAVLGVTFKPGTDDMRSSAALDLIPDLQDQGAVIRAYDPAGMQAAVLLLPDVVWARDAYAAAQGAHAIVLLTEWEEFRTLDFARMLPMLAEPVLVDLRNLYEPAAMAQLGFRYFPLGGQAQSDPQEPGCVSVKAQASI